MTFPLLVLGVLGTAALAGGLARVTKQYLLIAVASSAAILVLHSLLYFRYTADDAYISYRYARNLSDGIGLVWNPGEHVEGYSNFLWVVLLAGFHKLGADIVLTGRWLGFGLAIATAAGTYKLARMLVNDTDDVGGYAGLVATLLLAACGSWALWVTAGLEGPLLAALTLGGVLLQLRESPGASWRLPPVSGFLWAFVAMTRPDAVLLVAVSGLFKLVEVAVAANGAPAAERRAVALHELMRTGIWAAEFAALYVPYFAWRYSYYGWLFPNTYYAKVGSGPDQYERGLRYAAIFVQEYGGWMLLAVPLAVVLTRAPRLPILYVLSLVLVWMASIVYVGGDALARLRLFVPIIPLYYAVIVSSIGAIVAEMSRSVRPDRRLVAGVLSLTVACAMAYTLHPSAIGFGSGVFINSDRQAVTDHVDVGRWLKANFSSDTTVALIAAGGTPYESQLPTIDMLGLNDEHIAHRSLSLGEFAAGHEKYDTGYVLNRRPDIIIVYGSYSPTAFTRSEYNASIGVALIPAIADILANPRLDAEYATRAVQVREGKWLNLFVRKDAADVLAKTQAAPQ